MWAQMVKFRVAEENADRMQRLDDRWNEEVGRGTDSGWLRSIVLQNANDPQELFELVFFESEEKARANEKTPKHVALVEEMMALASSVDFVDLKPLKETSR